MWQVILVNLYLTQLQRRLNTIAVFITPGKQIYEPYSYSGLLSPNVLYPGADYQWFKGRYCLRLHFYPYGGLSISSGTSAPKTKRWHNPQDCIMHPHNRQNLKTYTRDKGQRFDTRFLLVPTTVCYIKRPTGTVTSRITVSTLTS